MAKQKIKTYSLNDLKEDLIGKRGTKEREKYEYKLQMDILGRMIKLARKESQLTQEQLGKIIGVQKAQISKLENSTNSASIDTIVKIFNALNADIHFQVTLGNRQLHLS